MGVMLTYALRAEQSYRYRGPVLIGFSIRNLTSHDIWVLKWYTPLEGIRGKILEVECDGVSVPYAGMMVKRGNPSVDDYLQLLPGTPVHIDFDLSQSYALPMAKKCKVRFKSRIYDLVDHFSQVPRTVERHSPVMIGGNEVVFEIV